MLIILLAACERALEAFQAADNPVDEEFVADLQRITERTRREVAAYADREGVQPAQITPSDSPRST